MYKIQVTDHAIVRYMERVLGLDLDDIRKEIMPVDKLPFINGDIKIKSGHRVLVRDKKAVTVYNNATRVYTCK